MNISFKRIFVTVGTTEFENLIKQIDNEAFINILLQLNCKELIIQIGRGVYIPINLPQSCANHSILYECYRFKSNLDENMKAADLIITHCGAGSIIEALTLEKIFIVIINDTLQGNHQTELAYALSNQNYCQYTSPSKLVNVLLTYTNSNNSSDSSSRKVFNKYPKPNYNLFPNHVESFFDFSQLD